jgi:RHS repeat-associated protein
VVTDHVFHATQGTLESSTSYRATAAGAVERLLQKLELRVSNLGNVEWRKSTTYDASGANASLKTENFAFDALNRLKTTQVVGQSLQSFVYADNGNIMNKTGVGAYTYGSTKKHAVESVAGSGGVSHVYAYDANGRMTTETAKQGGVEDRLIREIQYTSFHQPALITHHASPKLITDRPVMGDVEGFCEMAFYYGSDLQRLIQIKRKGAVTTRVLYLGAYEKREVLEAGVALLEREERSSFGNGAQVRLANEGNGFIVHVALEFSLKDHLGSTSAVHTENGDVKKSRGQTEVDERHSYDAWGARRDGATWAPAGPQLGHSAPVSANGGGANGNAASGSTTTDPPKVASSEPRGFTGHEMLDDVGLVHMNGRLYDAALGRFCSADPLIQETENAQNYNRYTYVLNNPLSHTDPSGYSALSRFFKKLLRAVLAILIAVYIVLAIVFTVGALLAAAQFMAGAAVVTSAKVVSGAIVGAAWSAINATIQGGTFAEVLRAAVMGAVSGAVGAMIGGALHDIKNPLVHAVAHGIAGGGMSEANGGSFKDGFIGSLIGAGVTSLTGFFFGGFANALGIVGRTALAALSGGTASVLAGGKFAAAAYSAAFFHLFNDEFGGKHKEDPDKINKQGRAVRDKIQAFFKANPGGVYHLSTSELFAILRMTCCI